MSFIRQLVGAGLQIAGILTANPWLYAAGTALTIYDARREQSKQRRAALQRYNDSLVDRLQMVDVLADAPRTMVLGQVRTVDGIRRRWVSGPNSEKLTLIVSIAGHELDAILGWYADDTLLTLDGSGYVQTAPYSKTSSDNHAEQTGLLDGTGAAAVVLPQTPISGSVLGYASTGSGDSYSEFQLTVVVNGLNVTLSGGPPNASYRVVYRYQTTTSLLRIRQWLGTDVQNVGSALELEYPGEISATDEFAGIALGVIDITYDPDVFPQGYPNFSAVVRGAKIYDPRLDTTVGGSGPQRENDPATWTYSDNAMLCAYHYARHANGMNLPAASIRTADVMAAADACDVSTNFTLRMPDQSTQPYVSARHRVGTVIPLDSAPAEAWDELVRAMCGKWGWAGGELRVRAGARAATAFTLTESWVAQPLDETGSAGQEPVVRISNGTPRDDRVNRVAGSCMNPDERYQVLPFPAIEDAALIALDGRPYQLDIDLPAVPHPALAQHIGSVLIRASQASLRMQVTCNMSAFRVELLDVGAVTLPRYGFSAKTFEVDKWSWSPVSGIELSASEITDAMFSPVAELSGQDPAPNTTLRDPRVVQAMTILAVESATEALVDGSVLTRTKISWTPATQQSVVYGGTIEVQYVEAVAGNPVASDWSVWPEPGGSAFAVIPGLLTGHHYLFRVRAVQPFPLVRGPWSDVVSHKIGAPPTVAGESYSMTFEDAAGIAFSNFA